MAHYETRQRKTLLAYLSRHADRLLSAQQIAEDLKDDSISLSAVYRNLAELEAEGKVRRSTRNGAREMDFQYMDAASCKGCLHLNCTRCGRTFHMDTGRAQRLLDAVSETEGFQVNMSETVLYGVCENCRKPS